MRIPEHFLVSCMLALLCGCDQQSQEPAETSVESVPPSANVQTRQTSPYYALRPIDDSWPDVRPGNIPVGNLLTDNYYIVLDGSGSMEGNDCAPGSTKMRVAKQAVAQFAKQVPSDANIALYAFDLRGARERLPLTANRLEEFFAQINQVIPGGNTPLATAITAGYRSLKAQAEKQLGYGEFHLVVITDGIATEGEAPDVIVQTILKESPIVIHSIGFCLRQNHALNQPGMTFYTAADSAEALQQGLQAVLAEAPDFSADHF
ncbi:MAG: vWA domain-containing protein [Gammaproteobacteria bacterium]